MTHQSPRSVVAMTLMAVSLLAAAYESPRSFKASEVLAPEQVKGPRHSVAPEVKTDGYFFIFQLNSDFGAFDAEGKSTLLTRLQEVNALAELDKVSKSQVFMQAAGASVVNVGKGVTAAVADPGATAKGIGGGLKRMGTNLGRKAKKAGDSAVDAAKGEGGGGGSTEQAVAGVAASTLGINGAARKWAQKVGVDPYTTNAVLKKALADIGKVDAAGGLAAKIAVPVPMVVSTTAKVGALVWSKDPEALAKLNEQALTEMGVSAADMKSLYASPFFTLTTYTRLITALREVNAKGCGDYASTATAVLTPREAVFFAESAEMLAVFHKTSPVTAILTDSRAMVAKTKDGKAVVLLPLDWISWTDAFEKALDSVETRAKQELGATKLEMRLTGKVSAAAKAELNKRGWTVAEGVTAG